MSEREEERSSLSRGAGEVGKGRLLIVDDEPQIREFLSDYFSSMGYLVATAKDGEEALSKCGPGLFDCVISDIVMPRIDGRDLLKRLKARDETVPFIVITGFPSIESAVETIRGGAYDYVTKPLQIEDLLVKVERALYTRGLERAVRAANERVRRLMVLIPVLFALAIALGIFWKRF